ncbi:MAG: hypothetical protein PHR35_06385, partial [Kiritimatiellae bacterium]|nr:hypothetical protein [Kiritimatiellia bacterium]
MTRHFHRALRMQACAILRICGHIVLTTAALGAAGSPLANGGFERFYGNANDGVRDRIPEWNEGGDPPGGLLEVVTDAHLGAYALLFRDVSTEVYSHARTVAELGALPDGGVVVVSAWFKCVDGKAAFIGIRKLPNREPSSYACTAIPDDGQWHRVENRLRIEPSDGDVAVEVLLSGQSDTAERKPADTVSVLL